MVLAMTQTDPNTIFNATLDNINFFLNLVANALLMLNIFEMKNFYTVKIKSKMKFILSYEWKKNKRIELGSGRHVFVKLRNSSTV